MYGSKVTIMEARESTHLAWVTGDVASQVGREEATFDKAVERRSRL